MKINANAIFLLFLSLGLFGCGPGHSASTPQAGPESSTVHAVTSVAPSVEPRSKWTVMVFLNAKNNLDPFSDPNFAQMASVGSSPDVQVVVDWGRLRWKNVYRVHVKKNMKIPVEPTADTADIKNIGSADMGSPDELASFISWSKQNYPADHYLLVIWDHGQGYRLEYLNKLTTRSFPAELMTMALPTTLPAKADHVSSYRSVSFDDKTHHHLYNSDIQKVLEKQHVDVLGFDACLMSMLETAYAVRKGAAIMVGSQELEPGAGWKYDGWLSILTRNPSTSPEELGVAIVNSYQATYESGVTPDATATLSVTRLNKIGGLTESVSKLGDELGLALSGPNGLNMIQNARNICPVYAPSYTSGDFQRFNYVDLGNFCEAIKSSSDNERLRSAAQDVIDHINAAVAKNWAGFARANTPYHSTGLSIYFPDSFSAYQNDRTSSEFGDGYEKDNTDHPVEFVADKNIHWSEFLHALYEKQAH